MPARQVPAVRFTDRVIAVGSVDVAASDAVPVIRGWVDKGLKGLRIFTGGSTKDFDPTELENPAAYPAWEVLGDLGIPMCIQTGPIGLPQVCDLAVRFPKVNIILDHLGRPDVLDGPPYANADSLFAMADLPNIYLKLTPRIMGDVTKGQASADTFFTKVAAVFGANRMAWGSNFPTSPGTLSDILATARDRLACLSDEDQNWVFAKTAQTLYPALKD